jgi:polyisoprenoid-binding protein YceI
MKRASVLVGIALFALFIFSNSGTQAVDQSFAERFAGGDKDDKKKDTTDYTGAYTFDKAHTFIGFKVKHMGLIEVPGFFRDFTGTVNYDAKDVTKSTVEFTAKATSADTGVAGRDAHLKKPEFFDVEKYPEITFKSTKVEKKGKNWILTGDFTLKGVTKSLTFPFNIAGFLPPGERGAKMGITAETSINRRDYGVTYGGNLPSGVAAVSDNVTITLQIEANGPKPPAAAGAAGPAPKP